MKAGEMTPLQRLLYDEYRRWWNERREALRIVARLRGELAEARVEVDQDHAALLRVHSLMAENGLDPERYQEIWPAARPEEYVLTGREPIAD